MADNQGDMLAKEVDEELRKEALLKLWKQYGNYLIAIAILVVLAVAGREVYSAITKADRVEKSDRYIAAEKAAFEAPETELSARVTAWEQAVGDLDGNYKTLAEMRLAAEKLEAGDIEGAIADYDALSRRGSIDEFVRELARLLGAMVVADELGQYEEALERLSLIKAQNRPISHSAREMEAFLMLKLDRLEEAFARFEALSLGAGVPQTIQARAVQMRDALNAKVVAADQVSVQTESEAVND